MPHKTKVRVFINNLLFAFLAQTVSLVLSVILSLLLPKLLDVTQYGYWQLFLFYTGYVGFLLFGFVNGIYLRMGGKEFSEFSPSLYKSQFCVMLLFEILLAALIIVFQFRFESDPSRQFVLTATAIYMVSFDVGSFFSYLYQAANQTKIYSKSVLLEKTLFLCLVAALLFLRIRTYQQYIIFYLVGNCCSMIYLCVRSRDILRAPIRIDKSTFREIGINISVGINLMVSNMASTLILGIGRFIIDRVWDIQTFGKLSLSLSITNFFLLFISQISMVLFPALRQTDPQQCKRFFVIGQNILDIILPGIFLFYLPAKYLLGLWLPQYADSLRYLALILPICTFDGKMQMLYNTYLKVFRKERILLAINLGACGFSAVLCIINGFFFHNLEAIAVSMVAAVALRSVISDLYLAKLIKLSALSQVLDDILLASVFLSCTWFLSPLWGFLIYLALYAIHLLFSRAKIHEVLKFAKNLT